MPIGHPAPKPKPDLAREDPPIGSAINLLWTIVIESAIPNSLRRLGPYLWKTVQTAIMRGKSI
jgi:hypothetical protein